MKIYCVRHGEALTADINPDRPLTPNGEREVEKVASQMQRCHIDVSHILHSSKSRTRRTAEIFGKILGSETIVECKTILDAKAELGAIWELVHSLHENTMIVGHLPFLHQLVSMLVLKNEGGYPIVHFSPATVVCLTLSDDRWFIDWQLSPEIVI